MAEMNELYNYAGTVRLGNITEKRSGEIVVANREQAIYLLSKANISVKTLEFVRKTRRSIESTLP